MNLLVTMSGGTTTVINATLAGLIKEAKKSSSINKVLAGSPGILGALDNSFIELNRMEDEELDHLSKTPGSSVIGTTRVSVLSKMNYIS